MSSNHTEKIVCPFCGVETEIRICDAVNALQDPDLKKDLLAGKLFSTVCGKCGKSFPVNHDLLYLDPSRRLLAWYVTSPERAKTLNNIGSANLFESLSVGPEARHRIAFSVNELFEIIHVAEANLDDRLTGFMKIVLESMLLKEKKADPTEILFLGEESESGERKISFHVRSSDGKNYMYALSRTMYDDLEKRLLPRLPARSAEFIRISREWFDPLIQGNPSAFGDD